MQSDLSRKPKILIMANYAPDAQFSQLGHAKWLVNEMPKEGFEVSVISPKKIFGGGTGEFAKWRGYIDKYILFPFVLYRASKKVDMVHIADHSYAMYGKFCAGRWGVTLHDLIPQRSIKGELEVNVRFTGRVLQNWIRTWLKRCQCVGSVSRASMEDYLRFINPDPSVLFLTPDCLYRDFHRIPENESQRLFEEAGISELLSTPFMFHIGGNGFTKNRRGYLRIVSELKKNPKFAHMKFVACGKTFDAKTRAVLEELNLQDTIIEVQSASDDMVLALYSRAQCLIFPSLVEGFGLPVLEAMACGCPVFTSGRLPMTEVGGQAARYFNPDNPAEAAEVISHHWDEREEMVAQGYIEAKRQNTAASSGAYAEWYHVVLNGEKSKAGSRAKATANITA